MLSQSFFLKTKSINEETYQNKGSKPFLFELGVAIMNSQ